MFPFEKDPETLEIQTNVAVQNVGFGQNIIQTKCMAPWYASLL